jgi:predicted Zn finger-like uncharacterized protein
MQTQCPSCRSVFRVSHQQLSAAEGLVRCGKCSVIFNGNENIKRLRSNTTAGATSTHHRASGAAPITAQPASVTTRRQKPRGESDSSSRSPPPALQLKAQALERASPGTTRATDSKDEASPPLPEEYYVNPLIQPHRARRTTLYASLALLMLLLLLTGGYVYGVRERLLDFPTLTTWISTACTLVGCKVEPPRDTDRIAIIGRNVYAPPDRQNILTITATLVNKASFAQPYPLMQVSFTNLQGTVLATRRFSPREYLSPPPDAIC